MLWLENNSSWIYFPRVSISDDVDLNKLIDENIDKMGTLTDLDDDIKESREKLYWCRSPCTSKSKGETFRQNKKKRWCSRIYVYDLPKKTQNVIDVLQFIALGRLMDLWKAEVLHLNLLILWRFNKRRKIFIFKFSVYLLYLYIWTL